MQSGLIIDIAVCIIAAWVLGVVFQVIKQPLLLAYLLAGFAVGPNGFQWVTDAQSIDTIAGIGLILLLFMIGLEIDLKKMLGAGKVITLTSLIQIVGSVGLGWWFFGAVGLAESRLEALYLGVAAAMSSTVIIVKLLYEKRELDTLAGRVTLGVMVLQDLATILFLAIQPNLKNPAVGAMGLAMGKVLLLVVVGFAVSRYVLPPIFKSVARVPELVLVGALAWCFALAGLASLLGLSREMGALIAGVAISTFPYTLDVTAKVTSLRDFFVTLFFVGLGMKIPVPTWDYVFWTLVFSIFLIGSRLLTVFPPLYAMRQGHRVSLLPAINLCQLSELSLVLLTLGNKDGQVSNVSVSVAAFTFAFLAVDSTYAILKSELLLRKTSGWLTSIGLRDLAGAPSNAGPSSQPRRIFFLGFFRTASSLLEEIARRNPDLLREVAVIDFNPQVNQELRVRGLHVVYGDISQRDTLLQAGVDQAEVVLSTIPNSLLKGVTNTRLVRQVREINPAARIIAPADTFPDVPRLYAAGADFVIVPRMVEAKHLCEILQAAREGQLADLRHETDRDLKDRKEVLP